MKPSKNKYNNLLTNIGQTIESARSNAVKAINTELVKANWEIGRHIVEFEQHGKERAECSSPSINRTHSDKVKIINFNTINYEYKKINIRRKGKDCSRS